MTRVVLLFIAALLGCSPEARGIELAELDLTDMETVRDIRGRLDDADSAAFASYVAKHHLRAAAFCGRPLTGTDGQLPKTVGEAIDLTMARDAEDKRALVEASRPRHPREVAKQSWDDLISERDRLIDAQSGLLELHGPASKRSAEWRALESSKLDVDRRLEAMKPLVFGSDS